MRGDHYLQIIWNDIEPELFGPFASVEDVVDEARKHRLKGHSEDGLFHLWVALKSGRAVINVRSFAVDELL